MGHRASVSARARRRPSRKCSPLEFALLLCLFLTRSSHLICLLRDGAASISLVLPIILSPA